MSGPYFLASERFDPSDGKSWQSYVDFAKIPGLNEVVSLDGMLCPRLIKELQAEDWNHNFHEDFRCHYFADLDYLVRRVSNFPRRNILAVFRNSISPASIDPSIGDFKFAGHDLIEDGTGISALTNCGGFPDVFGNDELNCFGLIESFEKACTIRRLLAEKHPEEAHAQCELYAIWRLDESPP